MLLSCREKPFHALHGAEQGKGQSIQCPHVHPPPTMATAPLMAPAPQHEVLMPVSGQASALLGQSSPKCLGASESILECWDADAVPLPKLSQLQRSFLLLGI